MTKQTVFLKGKMIFFRPLDEDDVPALQKWQNDPEVRQYIRRVFPISLIAEKEWVNGAGNDEHNVALAICLIETGELIGTMGLHGISWTNRTASTGTVIGEAKHQNKGYGVDAKMTLLKYAFHSLGLRKICASAYAFNTRSIKFNEKCGYKIEGILKEQVLRDGRYVDEVQLAVFERDWLPLWEKYNQE